MKLKTMKKGNEIINEIVWCNRVLKQMGEKSEFDLVFYGMKDDKTKRTEVYCPDWLKENIKESVSRYREYKKAQFNNLKDE